MPNSTTLETLVLEIDSSAKGANEGIGRTVGSLRSLARAVGTVLPGLREMNRELQKTARLKIPNVGGSITRGAKKPSIITPETPGKFTPKIPYNFPAYMWNSLTPEQQRMMEKGFRMRYAQQHEYEKAQTLAGADERRKLFSEGLKNNPVVGTKELSQAAKDTGTIANNIKKIGDNAQTSEPKVSKWAKTLSTVGRIFKTMIIRTAIRSLIKAFSESWNAAYEFSKHLGGSFATAVDSAKTLLYDMSTTIIQTVAPVFEALVPILKVVTDAISYLCSGVQYLLRLMGLTSDVTGAATQNINKYISASGKGGKATKNMLASWDQLNIIQSKGSSGSGGSSYNPGALKKLVSAEVDSITRMWVGEGALAIGLILACTGHIGAGVGLMAIGAASIAKTLIEDWGKLPREVQASITKIMTIAGGSMLGLGVILACSGNIPLGLGLIAAGVANLGLAIGLNWNDLVENVTGVMTTIRNWFVNCWNDIKSTAMAAWGAVSNWWTTNVLENIEKEGAWGGVKGFFSGVFNTVKDTADLAWTSLNDWMDTNIGTSFRTAWGEVTNVFKSIFGTTEQPDTVVGMIHGAFQDVQLWWDIDIKDKIENAWNGISDFFSGLFGSTEQPDTIVGKIHDAWQDVSEWWNTNVTQKVEAEGAWGGINGFFQGIFTGEDGTGGILGAFNTMWDGISKFWSDDVVKPIEEAWSNVSTWFYTNVTKPVSDFFINMVNRMIDGLNWLIDCLNTVGHVTWGGLDLGILGKIPGFDTKIFEIPKVEYVAFGANGLYDVPKGDLFVANEAGAELVGSMNGRTTVANQQQIIEGIQKGVAEANADQNELLRQQNELLRQILQKSFEISPTAAWGQFTEKSLNLWNGMTGG